MMRPIIIGISLIFLFACNSNRNIDIETEISKSYDMIENLQFQKAYDRLSYLLKIAPKNSRAFNYRGVAALRMGDFKKALIDLNRAFSIDSTDVDINLNMGVYYGTTGNIKEAIKFYNKAIAIDSLCIKAFSNLGVLCTNSGKLQEALEYHEKAILIDPNFGGSYVNRAETYLALGKMSEALGDYEKALKYDTGNKDVRLYALCRRGTLYRELKDYKSAIQDFSDAIKINNQDMYTYYYRGLSYAGISNYELALSDFQKAKNLGMENMHDIIEECQRFIE